MKKLRAFTLVELLVVISIIAMLLSILMPSLSKARQQAKKVICTHNCRQWVTATTLYVCDSDDRFPLRYLDMRARAQNWQGWPNEYYYETSSTRASFDIISSLLNSYVHERKDIVCPGISNRDADARNYDWKYQKQTWGRVRGDYSFFFGYKAARTPGLSWGSEIATPLNERAYDGYAVPPKISSCPSGMALVGDAVMFHRDYDLWLYASPHPFKYRPSGDQYKFSGMCAGFVDGHSGFSKKGNIVPFFSYNRGVFYWPKPR